MIYPEGDSGDDFPGRDPEIESLLTEAIEPVMSAYRSSGDFDEDVRQLNIAIHTAVGRLAADVRVETYPLDDEMGILEEQVAAFYFPPLPAGEHMDLLGPEDEEESYQKPRVVVEVYFDNELDELYFVNVSTWDQWVRKTAA